MPDYHPITSKETTRHVWDFPEKELIALLKDSLNSHDGIVPTGKAFLRWERQSRFKKTRTVSLIIDE